MVNQIGGKNYKKGKKGGRKTKNPTYLYNVDNTTYFYGQVLGKLGHNRLEVKLQTGQVVQAVIPGRFMKKVWIHKEDYVVVNCVNEKFYDVVQKVVQTEAMTIASTLMGTKMDKDNNDLYNPFIDKQDSDEDIDTEEQEDKYDNDDDNDDELLEISNSKINVINPTKISEQNLIRKQQNKERDINKRNRERVFTNTVVQLSESSKNDNDDNDDDDDDNDDDDDEDDDDDDNDEDDEDDEDEVNDFKISNKTVQKINHNHKQDIKSTTAIKSINSSKTTKATKPENPSKITRYIPTEQDKIDDLIDII